MRKNQAIADLLYKIADMLEFKDVAWEPRAYRRAASAIESLTEDIEEIWKRGELKEISGVGDSIANSIEKYIKTGTMEKFEKLKKETPEELHIIMNIQGIGPKKAKKMYQELGIETIEALEKAVKEHKIRELEGFGKKSEENILKGIELSKEGQKRATLDKRLGVANDVVKTLKQLKEVANISIAGSLRRRKETIGDVDILVTGSDFETIMEEFTSLPSVRRVLGRGPTKSSIILEPDVQIDLRILEEDNWGSGLLYFTGSKDHNIELRKVAIGLDYKLSEYGLFKGKENIASKTEEEIYEKLGMQWIPPELRENRGEIEAAKENKLPKLIEYDSLKGDFHIHTNYSDGSNSIEEMAKAAEKRGYEYICISDHSKSERIAGGLTEEEIVDQIKAIKKVDKECKNIKILAGIEVSIMKEGKLDFDDSVLKKCDLVIAAVHSNLKMSATEMTERIVKAIKNPYVDILGHPTGRIIHKRSAYDANWNKIFQVAKENNVHMAINAHPTRLDLKDTMIKDAKEYGIKFAINSDAHNIEQLSVVEYGLATARRGWLRKEDVINAYPLKKLSKLLKNFKL